MLKKLIFLFPVVIFALFCASATSAFAATLYFNNATGDFNWGTLGNWWSNSGFTVPAVGLPGSSDDVIVSARVNSNSSGAISLHSATFNGTNFIFVPFAVSNGATFNNTTGAARIITGDATFNDSARLSGGSSGVTGKAFFNDSSQVQGGTVTGTSTFTGSARNAGTLNGTTTFSNSSFNDGTVNNQTTFNNTAYNSAVINGNVILNAASGGTMSLSGSMIWGTVTGTVKDVSLNPVTNYIFTNSSTNQGTLNGNATFNDSSYNTGTVSGNAVFNYASGGTLSLSGIMGWGSVTGTVKDGGGNTITTYIFNDDSFVNSGATVNGNAIFVGDDSSNAGTITGSVTRKYTAPITTTHDFTDEGGYAAIVIADGVAVDISGATYDGTNVFKTLNNGSFVPSAVVPAVSITSPSASSITTWSPVVSWGTSAVCAYNYDAASYTTISCASNGSNIPAPSVGSHTLYVRGTDASGNSNERSVAFSYSVVSSGSGGGSTGGNLINIQPMSQFATPQARLANQTFMAGGSTNTAKLLVCPDMESPYTGACVKMLQQFLNSIGFVVATTGAGSMGKETAFFGPATRAALIRFQKAKGITPPVGYFGPKTRFTIKNL